jgi:hypothetical protein
VVFVLVIDIQGPCAVSKSLEIMSREIMMFSTDIHGAFD